MEKQISKRAGREHHLRFPNKKKLFEKEVILPLERDDKNIIIVNNIKYKSNKRKVVK